MTTTTTSTSPATSSARPIPQDRLGKVARTTTVTLYTDERPALAAEAAHAALAQHDLTAATTRPARLAQARAQARENIGAAGRAHLEAARRGQELSAAEAERIAEDAEYAREAAERAQLAAEVEGADALARSATLTFTFRSLGRTRWRQAVAANPPTDADRAEWTRAGLDGEPPYSVEGLLRYVLTHALVSPALDEQGVAEILDGECWSEPEVAELWAAALGAQTSHSRPTLGHLPPAGQIPATTSATGR